MFRLQKRDWKSADWRKFCITICIGTVAVLFLLLMYRADLKDFIPDYVTHIGDRNEQKIIENFTSDYLVSQEFTSKWNFDFLSLNFSDHDVTIQGKTIVSVYEKESDTLVYYQEIDNPDIDYGVPVRLSWSDDNKAGKSYIIKLQEFDTEDVALGLYGYRAEANDVPAEINGVISDFTMSVGAHSYTNCFRVLVAVLMSLSFITIFITAFMLFVKKASMEKVFLSIAIPFGICMLLCSGYNDAYDGIRHMETAYHFSNVLFGIGDEDGTTEISMRVDDAFLKRELEEHGKNTINAQLQDFWLLCQNAMEPLRNDSLVKVDNVDVISSGTVIEYFPGALGLTIGRLLHLNAFSVISLAKILTFIVFLVICYCTIKLTPIAKEVFLIVSLLPMSLYQGTGVTYDGMTYSLGIFTIALILRLWQTKIKKKGWGALYISVFLLGNCKGGVYLTIILLLFIVPKEHFPQKKILMCFTIFLLAFITILIRYLPVYSTYMPKESNAIKTEEIMQSDEGYDEQVIIDKSTPPWVKEKTYGTGYAFSNPLEFIGLFMRTLIYRGETYAGSLLGYRTHWSNKPISWDVMLPFFIILFFASIKTDKDRKDILIRERICILSILVIEFVGFHIFFLMETITRVNYITVINGRYFLAFLPLAVILFRNNGLQYKNDSNKIIFFWYTIAFNYYIYFFIKMFLCD